MATKKVLTKKSFTERYTQGEFGNASPTWATPIEWYNSRIKHNLFYFDSKLYHLRNRIKGGHTVYNLQCRQLKDAVDMCPWVSEPNWYVSEMAPTELTLLQGEVNRTTNGIYLQASRECVPMRQALANTHNVFHLFGINAKITLKRYLNDWSYEWLMQLLDVYTGHTVEFSTYSKCWGTVPGFNTVFWEVRAY
jgi:hypothetical protein